MIIAGFVRISEPIPSIGFDAAFMEVYPSWTRAVAGDGGKNVLVPAGERGL